jgi:ribulose-5-phosphate 4-epimerase/fuculose-1-phosphate aldolase
VFFSRYADKIIHAGLAGEGGIVIGLLDDKPTWNRPEDPVAAVLSPLFDHLNINAVLFLKPVPPWDAIFDFYSKGHKTVYPQDSETRTFLHDIPVAASFTAASLASCLSTRKCVLTPGGGVVAHGGFGVEQAYVTVSSVAFALFVKFFSDALKSPEDPRIRDCLRQAAPDLDPPPRIHESLAEGPFSTAASALSAAAEAGRATVKNRLVDSVFGNISVKHEDVLYISRTGSFLEDLDAEMDPCPLDGSSTAPLTASSELPAHLRIVRETGAAAVLHGHPKYAVILSMVCDETHCGHLGECHRRCPGKRFACGAPIVPGEVGAGEFGLFRTVPDALTRHSAVIVYGHGVFTAGRTDFNEAYQALAGLEADCRAEVLRRLAL